MTKSNDSEFHTPTVEDEWMIRPCSVYEDEYSDCRTIKARFHQYFIFGKSLDCSGWRRDFDNCNRWAENKDLKSANELIENEKKRRKERLEPHHTNDIWPRRRTPPDNWNAPLPENMLQEYETSYLNIKSKEMKGEIPPTTDLPNFCILM